MQVANAETIRTPSDGFTHRRMKDYMKPEDLNTDGVVMLASAVLAEAAAAYVHAKAATLRHPNDKDAQEHLKTCVLFYRSDWYKALSGGLVDGDAVMLELDRQAERRR